MKTKLFLLSAAAIVALTGCQKETAPEPESETGIPTVMEIQLTGGESSKAIGTPNTTTETSITKGVILVFRGTGADPTLDSRTNFDLTGSNVAPIKVNITRGIRQVYVVANVNTIDFASVYKLSDLEHLANKLSLNAFRTSGALPMSGFVNNVDATNSTTTTPLRVPVQLNFIGSRVHVDWDATAAPVGVTITGAVLLNVNAKSEYIATSNGSSSYNPLTYSLWDYLQGVGDVSGFTGSHLPSSGMSGTTNNPDTELLIQSTNQGFANNYTYVFENGSIKPMIVAIKGTYNTKTYYWPIVINGALNGIGGTNQGDGSASVKRGMIYKVKAIIKNVGFEDPYAPVNTGALEVEIIPASWQPEISIDQDFN